MTIMSSNLNFQISNPPSKGRGSKSKSSKKQTKTKAKKSVKRKGK